MKPTNHYNNWTQESAYNLLNKSFPKDTIVWNSTLCEAGTTDPDVCEHRCAVSLSDFRKSQPDVDFWCYYTHYEPFYKKYKVIGSGVTVVIVFITALINLHTATVNATGISRDTECNCEIEDIKVGEGEDMAHFRIAYLSEEEKWKIGSSSILQNGSKATNHLIHQWFYREFGY